MKHFRQRLSYANVMSSLAVFLVLGGGAVAASNLPRNSVGSAQLQRNAVKGGKIARNAVKVGKIAPEAVRAGKLSKDAVPSNRLRNNAVTAPKVANGAIHTEKIAADAVTGAKVRESTLGQVPDAAALGGIAASQYAQRFFARVAYSDSDPSIVASSPGVTAVDEQGEGAPRLAFPRSMNDCAVVASASDDTAARIVQRSGTGTGAIVQFTIRDEAGALVRSDFDAIAIC